MDFIERVLGFSPDGGSGTAELFLVLVPLLVIPLLTARRIRRSEFPDTRIQPFHERGSGPPSGLFLSD